MTDNSRSAATVEPSAPRPSSFGRVMQAILAVVTLLQVILVATQAILAGIGLDGRAIGADLHESNSTVVAIVGVVQVIAAVLWWRPGRGRGAAPLLAAGLLLAVMAQMVAGQNSVLAVHIPLGIGILLGSIWLLRLALRRQPSST